MNRYIYEAGSNAICAGKLVVDIKIRKLSQVWRDRFSRLQSQETFTLLEAFTVQQKKKK